MAPCLHHFKREFRKNNFGSDGVHPDRFATSQWNFPPIVYLTYRIALAIYTDFWVIYTASKSRFSKIKFTGWPYALTNWTYFMEALYFTMHASMAIFHYLHVSKQQNICQRRSIEKHIELFDELEPSTRSEEYEIVKGSGENVSRTSHEVPIYLKVVWVLQNIASVGALLVTLIYYSILWPNREEKGPAQLDDIQVHGINSVLIFIEHCISASPIRLLHFIYPLIYGFIYVMFSIILWVVDTNHVSYPEVLDWNDPEQSVISVVLIGVFVVPVLQVIFFGLYKLRIYIFKKTYFVNASI